LGRFVNRDPWVKNPWHADINRQKRVTEYASALNERLVIAELSKNGKEIGHIFKLKNELAAGIIPEVIAKGTGSPTSLDGYKDGFNLYGAYYAPNGTDPTGERGYWGCVCLGLKCELYTAACIAAAPLAFAACAGVCTGTLGLGCIGCVIAGAAGTVAACEAAYDCLSTYYDECL
jgi:ABC-type dipeptide/oligopeptide/nickel transport system permease subunit